MPAPSWSEPFQRLILRLAVERDWPLRIPGALGEELFAGLASSQLRPPRQRIAAHVARYWAERGFPPGTVIVGELVHQEAGHLAGAERDALLAEWAAVAQVDLPEDASFAEEQVRGWASYQRFARAFVLAAAMLEQPDRDYNKIQAYVEEELAVGAGALQPVIEQLIAGAPERIAAWGSDSGDWLKIPTGLP